MTMERAWSGWGQRFELTQQHVPSVDPELSGGLLGELEGGKERLSGGVGRLDARQISEEPGSADGGSSGWKSRYHRHPHPH